MAKKVQKEEQIKKIKQDRIINEMKEANFKPQINKNSEIINSHSPLKIYEKVEDRLIDYATRMQDKIIKAKTKQRLLEHEYSYHPDVGEKSQIIATFKRKDRINKISKNLNKSDINLSISQRNTFKSFDGIESHMNTDYNVDSEEEFREVNTKHKNDKKKSVISSENTFTNMKKNNDTVIKSERSISYSNTDGRAKSKDLDRSKTTSNLSNASKKKIPVEINPKKNLHDYLYLEHKMKEEKIKQNEKDFVKENYPFKPTIPESSKKLINRNETKQQFIQRLNGTKKLAQEIVVQTKKKDSVTGKDLYKPVVSRGPRNPKSREVTVNLDGYYDQKILEEKKKIHELEMLNNLEKKKIWLESSMKSVLKMKIEKFKEIFELLDSDMDGFISSRNIKLSCLDSDMLKTLTPLLEELQKKGTNMDFKEFCLLADKLLSVKIFNNK